MYVVISNETDISKKVESGEAFAAKGHKAFEKESEANDWANEHVGHDKYKVYPLCDCEPNHFMDMGSSKYKSMRKILKPTLIGKPKE